MTKLSRQKANACSRGGKSGLTANRHKIWGLIEMLHLLTVVMVTQPHTFVKTHPTTHLKLVNFMYEFIPQ